ncbi:VOC family protein [Paeniroseomonas aquatica]|uniref:VOC family protein n=1 Tax=Paeniroseomonas aquatica TaxID=373043 RepID=UPI00361FF5B1
MAPLVQNITQVGIVVRDLDKALDQYANRLGVGPWRVYTYAPPKLTGMRIRGIETPYSMKLALAWTNEMMWELIQPLEGPSIYQEFLRDHGEGIHHVMVDYGDRTLAETTAEFTARGWPPVMEGIPRQPVRLLRDRGQPDHDDRGAVFRTGLAAAGAGLLVPGGAEMTGERRAWRN